MDSGLPWGCLVDPFAAIPPSRVTRIRASEVDRCRSCFAYINPHVRWSWQSWRCPLCRNWTRCGPRYRKKRDNEGNLELRYDVIEYVKDEVVEEPQSEGKGLGGSALSARHPIYLFLVDLTGDDDAIEVIKAGMLASLDALPPCVWVGLVVCAAKIGFYDLRSDTPHVRHVRIRSDGTCSPSVGECVLLENFVVPLEAAKENIGTAIDSLKPARADPRQRGGRRVAASPSKRSGWWSYSEPLTAQMRSIISKGTAAALRAASPRTPRDPLLPVHSPVGEEGKRPEDGVWRPGSLDAKGASSPLHRRPAPERNGFGSAVYALVDMIRHTQDDAEGAEDAEDAQDAGPGYSSAGGLNVRMLCFLTSKPNYGLGGVTTARAAAAAAASGGGAPRQRAPSSSSSRHPSAGAREEEDKQQEAVATAFYERTAALAAVSGVCIDLFAVSRGEVGMAMMRPLSAVTNGQLRLYNELHRGTCTLGSDLYKHLSLPHAFSGLLRLRTSTEFTIGRVCGAVPRDDAYESILVLPACDPHSLLAIDFAYTTKAGFGKNHPPVIQMAFQYTALEPAGEEEEEGGGRQGRGESGEEGSAAERLVVRSRLRVVTVVCQTAVGLKQVYDSADKYAIVAHLTHQALDEAKGSDALLVESQQLLREWITDLIISYNAHRDPSGEKALDLTFETLPSLKGLTRLVFALTKSSLLRPKHVPRDYLSYLHSLFTSLAPEPLAKGLYPALSAWSSLDTCVATHMPLRKSSLSEHEVYLLEAYSLVAVLYTRKALEGKLPMPPPHHAKLRKTIKKLKKETLQLSPLVVYAKMGTTEDRYFECHLLEEPNAAGVGFAEFLRAMEEEVNSALNRN